LPPRGRLLLTPRALVRRDGGALGLLEVERRMEGQRQGPLVAAVGAGNRTLVPVRAEAVQRVRADLSLDPPLPQRLERLVAPVELHHVGLPAVPVAFLRTRTLDDPGAPIGAGGGRPPP